MGVTSSYFWPTINGRVYYDKPLGSYWLVVAATWVTGGMNEAAARLPCAIAGLLAVFFLIRIGRRLYDTRTGVVAGFILATSFSFVFFSRHASADVETIAGETAALLLFLCNEDHPDGWWVFALWLVMAVTSQMKGLLGFVLPIVVIGSYCVLADGQRELRRHLLSGPIAQRSRWLLARSRWLVNWKTPFAMAIAGAIYYAPFAISHLRTGSGRGLFMVYRENVQRYFEPFDHRGPIYLYLYVIFALMAPWSVMLPAALVNGYQKLRDDSDSARSNRFTLVFFWATFIFFTASGSRRSYYLLPILPAAAIIVARVLLQQPSDLSRSTRRLINLGFLIVAVAVALSTLAFIPPRLTLPHPYSELPPAPDLPIFAFFWIGSILSVIYALRDLRPTRIALTLGAISYLFMFYLFVFAIPAGDAYRGEKPFALNVLKVINHDASGLAFYKNAGPVFYLNLPRPVPEYDTLADLDRAVRTGTVQWLVARRRDIAGLNFPNHPVTAEKVYPWDPREHALNALVLLSLPPAS